jgi:transcription elongation factor GreB
MKAASTPAEPRSPYITQAGWDRLNNEQQDLWERRRAVVRHLAAAAAEGDRSENAEYIYRKKQLRELDRRIRYLQKRLPQLKVVAQQPDDASRVFFGAWVAVENAGGEQARYRIVGGDEIDPPRNWISIDSPMARALLKRQVDDEIRVATPLGTVTWWVTAIGYADPDG